MLLVLRSLWISFRTVFIFVFAVILSVGLLTIMPMVQWVALNGLQFQEKKTFQVTPMAQAIPNKPKTPPRENKPKPRAPSTPQGPKAMARSTLSMDLGVGGSGGVAIGGVDAAGGQMVYAEGETDQDAIPLRQVAPEYPEEARKAGVSGLVRVLITIQEDGSVGDIRFLETPGNYGFEKVIREALTQWRFEPAQVGGVPVKQKMEQPFQF